MASISNVYWSTSGKFAFQKVGSCYMVFGDDGYFIAEFRTFKEMDEYIKTIEKGE